MLHRSWFARSGSALFLALLAGACARTPFSPAPSAPPTPPAIAQPAPVPQQNVAPGAAPPPAPLETAPLTPPPPALRLTAPGAVRVGLLAPLTGPSAAIGRALLEAAQLALFDFPDAPIALLPRDTGGTPEGAASAAADLLRNDVRLLIGPLFAPEVAAVAGPARAAGVPVVAFSTDRTVAGPGVWILGFTLEEQVRRVTEFARARGINRFAVLAPDNPYGAAATGAMVRTLERAGLQLAKAGRYPTEAADLNPAVRAFAQGATGADPGYDAILLPDGGARVKSVGPLLAYYDVDQPAIRYLGTGLWDDPTLGTESAMVGGWFASADPAGAVEFRTRYEGVYGRRPPRIASLGFDAMALAAVLAKDGGYAPARLADPEGFAGYDGIFRLLPDGTNERGLAVLEVQRGGFRVLDPAPTSFRPLAN